MISSGLPELWCGIHTDPILRCLVNPEGLNCEDLLDGVVPKFASWYGLRLRIEVLSQDLSGAWATFRG
jgi:hypothetical protein